MYNSSGLVLIHSEIYKCTLGLFSKWCRLTFVLKFVIFREGVIILRESISPPTPCNRGGFFHHGFHSLTVNISALKHSKIYLCFKFLPPASVNLRGPSCKILVCNNVKS